jgi:RNA polymerase sigma-70 factor (ECF subfamily)
LPTESLDPPHDAAPSDGARDTPSLTLDAAYRAHAADVSRFIRRHYGPHDTADILHEVFLVVQRKLEHFRGDSSLRTFLYAVALRVVVSRRRKRKLRRLLFLEREAELASADAPETPHALAERNEAGVIVTRVLDRLSERDRTLIVLFELEALPAAEIARIIGLRENAVWVAIHRARARFRAAHSEIFGEGASAP